MPNKTITEIEDLLKVTGKTPIPTDLNVYRVPSGIPGLDSMIEGGFEKGSVVLLLGIPGSGKTTFALQFLHHGAANLGEPGVFITFAEKKESIYKHALSFGWDFAELERKGLFEFLQFRPHQVPSLIEEGGGSLKDEIKAIGAKRIAIDSITAYTLLFSEDYQKRESIVSFIERLHEWDCTSIIISEMPLMVSETHEGSVGFLSDAMIALHYMKIKGIGSRVHGLEILKMRGTKHSTKTCKMAFESNGLVVYPTEEP